MVRRHGPPSNAGTDDGHGAVVEPQLVGPRADGLQLVVQPDRPRLGPDHVRRDLSVRPAGVGGSEVLLQGPGGGLVRPGGCIRACWLNFGSQSQSPIAPPNTVVTPAARWRRWHDQQCPADQRQWLQPRRRSGHPRGEAGPRSAISRAGSPADPVLASEPVSSPGAPPTGPISSDTPPITIAPAPVATPAPAAASGRIRRFLPPTGAGTSSNTSAASTRHHHKHVPHAVDTVLSGWAGHRRRAQTTSRVRQGGHGPSSAS